MKIKCLNNNKIWFKTKSISWSTSEKPNMVPCGISEGSFKFPLKTGKIVNIAPHYLHTTA